MLRLEHLAIGHARAALHRNLCATLPTGTLTALIGRNGTGKSTLLRTIATLLPAIEGGVFLAGESLHALTPAEVARHIALVLPTRIEASALRVDELVALGRMPHHSLLGRHGERDRVAIERAIALTELEPLLHREVRTLSDGERQRAMLARALTQDTPLLLLDEPTAFLDHPSKQAILALLQRIAHEEQKTILLSSHDLALTLPLADLIWLLTEQGLCTGTPESMTEAMEREFSLSR